MAQTEHTATEPAFAIAPLSDVMAAEVLGIDLSQPLADGVLDTIYDAFVTHHILVFREQRLTESQQVDFSLQFGPLEAHVNRDFRSEAIPKVHRVSNLDADGNPTSKLASVGNFHWHSDKSYMALPSLATFLYGVELPPEGGDTRFANMHAAYEALPAAKQAAISDLQVVHSWEASRLKSGSRPATDPEKQDAPPVVHPMVRTHPDTGRKGLYIGTHTSHVEAMPMAEGEALLRELQDFATQDPFVYRHAWRVGDLVMWDNRCLLHCATADFDLERYRRVLHRTVVRGARPA